MNNREKVSRKWIFIISHKTRYASKSVLCSWLKQTEESRKKKVYFEAPYRNNTNRPNIRTDPKWKEGNSLKACPAVPIKPMMPTQVLVWGVPGSDSQKWARRTKGRLLYASNISGHSLLPQPECLCSDLSFAELCFRMKGIGLELHVLKKILQPYFWRLSLHHLLKRNPNQSCEGKVFTAPI